MNWEVIKQRVQEIQTGDATGHDFYHTLRVVAMSRRLAVCETCNLDVVLLSAYLHDMATINWAIPRKPAGFTLSDYGRGRGAAAGAGRRAGGCGKRVVYYRYAVPPGAANGERHCMRRRPPRRHGRYWHCPYVCLWRRQGAAYFQP